jgi:hypothetical protein
VHSRLLSLGVSLVLLIGLCCAHAAVAAAQSASAAAPSTLALLPLDAPGKLAIYGQPVAGEVARTLSAAGLAVVVVGAQMAVPPQAALVIEGSLAQSRKRVTVELRLRALNDRQALAVVSASQASLSKLEQAAAAAARQLLPQVQAELARRAAPASPAAPTEPPPAGKPVVASGPPAPELPTLWLAVSTAQLSAPHHEAFAAELQRAGARLSPRWRPREVQLPELHPAALLAIATAPGALAIALDVRQLELQDRAVFVGKVQARAIVVFGGRVVFDRVVLTDSVIGGRNGTLEAMLALLAREVMAIVRPRLMGALAGSPALAQHAPR